MKIVHGLHFNNLRGDIYGGLVAAVVALPLALAFGVASGAGAMAGLYGAIFLGFFAAIFGGTPAQCSGPTGPMTVVMAGIVLQFADQPALAFTTVMLGGLFQILFGLFGFGQYIALVPYPVISGFMSGIGSIILILQIGPLLGHAAHSEGILANLLAIPEFFSHLSLDAAFLGLLTLGVMSFTPGVIGRVIPPQLLALCVGTLTAWLFLPEVSVIGEVPKGFPSMIQPMIQPDALTIMVESALVLALLGSIDSLLTSLVCDNMTRSHHDSNRELIGQGIGNMAAGLFGGLPGAGATMRSVANIRTGGRTPISGVVMALVLFATVLGLGPLAEQIPLPVLAGILIKVGIDIIDWRFLRHFADAPRADVFIMSVVLLMTVLIDLIAAVGVGLVLASLLFVKRMADLELTNLRLITGPSREIPLDREEMAILERNQGKILLIHMDGPMSFGSAKNMVRRVENMEGVAHVPSVVLDLSDVTAIDGTAALAVENMLAMIQDNGQHLFLTGVHGVTRRVLEGIGVMAKMRPGHLFAIRVDALRHAAYVAGSTHPDDQPPPLQIVVPELVYQSRKDTEHTGHTGDVVPV